MIDYSLRNVVYVNYSCFLVGTYQLDSDNLMGLFDCEKRKS